jgi:hypothetical protein
MLAIYLPGGLNAGEYPPEGTAVLFVLDDLLPFLTWWGAADSVLAIAWLAWRERALPRWVGALGLLALLPPLALLVVFGMPGLFGVTVPLWLIVTGTAMAVSRRADGAAPTGRGLGQRQRCRHMRRAHPASSADVCPSYVACHPGVAVLTCR